MVSSRPRLIDLITGFPGILVARSSRTMTTEYGFTFSRHVLPEACIVVRPLENRGRREDRVRAAPAVSCAIAHRKRAHEHTGSAGASRPSLRSGFTAYFVLSPVNGSFATVAPQEALLPKELDASTAASGPHDFAVRLSQPRQSWLSRPPHPTARRDDRDRPSSAVRRAELNH